MELMLTVNADKRYYLDENLKKGEGRIMNGSSLISTMYRFNACKIDLYNRLYDIKYDEKVNDYAGFHSYDSYLKDRWETMTSYYTCCIYDEARAVVSSQEELHKLYRKNMEEDIKTRKEKIKDTEKELEKKTAVKTSIRTYFKGGKWTRPYKGCRLKVTGNSMTLPGNKKVPLIEYERQVEEKIDRLRHRIKMLKYGLSRKEQKLQNNKDLPPKRVIFGTRKAYAKKDAWDTDKDKWREDFHFYRARSMTLSGRKTSKRGNFLVRMEGNDLTVTCMDGKKAILKDFRLKRYWKEYQAMLDLPPKERKPICYNFVLKKDREGRFYLIPSVTLRLENNNTNFGFSDGCVAMDMNWDNVTFSNLDAKGGCLEHFAVHFQLEGKTAGQIINIIGNVMALAGDYCRDVKKPLVIEDIDMEKKRNGLRYKSKKGNRHVSLFAFDKITSCAYSQGFQKGFEVYKVDPAYTSQIAKILYMRVMGVSIHEAASYTIGLKAMGNIDDLRPWPTIGSLLPEKTRKEGTVWEQWACITRAFRSVRTHLFYGKPPYEEIAKKKKPTLKTYADALKAMDKQKPA